MDKSPISLARGELFRSPITIRAATRPTLATVAPALDVVPESVGTPASAGLRRVRAAVAVLLAFGIIVTAGMLLLSSTLAPAPALPDLATWAHVSRIEPRAPQPSNDSQELTIDGALTLADVMLTFGAPERVQCLDYGLLRGKPVTWLMLTFDGDQIEALIPLTGGTRRLSPDLPVHILRSYATGAMYAEAQNVRWQGFVLISRFGYCSSHPVATPT